MTSGSRQRLRRRPYLAVSMAAVLAAATVVRAAAPPAAAVPPDLQAAIFSRVLSFDRALKPRVGKTITIGILFLSDREDSKQSRQRMLRAFDGLEKDIQGLPFRLTSHPYRDARQLGTWIDENEIDVIYVTEGFESVLVPVRDVVKEKKVATLCPLREYVEEGLAIAVIAHKNRPQLVVNLPAARAAGMDLDPKVLQLAQVIK